MATALRPGRASPTATSEGTRHTMQANRGKDTKPELVVRRILRHAGYPGYRLHWRKAVGRPDIAFPGRKIAVFVNGCYWHRCPSCRPPMPKQNSDFWAAKFVANEERDARNAADLRSAGWTVVTIWECEIRRDPEAVRLTLQTTLEQTRR